MGQTKKSCKILREFARAEANIFQISQRLCGRYGKITNYLCRVSPKQTLMKTVTVGGKNILHILDIFDKYIF